jgi:hypothetical protein
VEVRVKDALDFNGFRPEDRWLWFAVRLSLVLFLVGLEAVVVAGVAMVVLGL